MNNLEKINNQYFKGINRIDQATTDIKNYYYTLKIQGCQCNEAKIKTI